eukprot:Amastigsp_a3339_12.p2 type:complete len:364 gc:universal Amastigsp_a3339_12:1619-528(-)
MGLDQHGGPVARRQRANVLLAVLQRAHPQDSRANGLCCGRLIRPQALPGGNGSRSQEALRNKPRRSRPRHSNSAPARARCSRQRPCGIVLPWRRRQLVLVDVVRDGRHKAERRVAERRDRAPPGAHAERRDEAPGAAPAAGVPHPPASGVGRHQLGPPRHGRRQTQPGAARAARQASARQARADCARRLADHARAPHDPRAPRRGARPRDKGARRAAGETAAVAERPAEENNARRLPGRGSLRHASAVRGPRHGLLQHPPAAPPARGSARAAPLRRRARDADPRPALRGRPSPARDPCPRVVCRRHAAAAGHEDGVQVHGHGPHFGRRAVLDGHVVHRGALPDYQRRASAASHQAQQTRKQRG